MTYHMNNWDENTSARFPHGSESGLKALRMGQGEGAGCMREQVVQRHC